MPQTNLREQPVSPEPALPALTKKCVKVWLRIYKKCCFFVVVFYALRPKSTAMVIAGRSVDLTTLFPGQA